MLKCRWHQSSALFFRIGELYLAILNETLSEINKTKRRRINYAHILHYKKLLRTLCALLIYTYTNLPIPPILINLTMTNSIYLLHTARYVTKCDETHPPSTTTGVALESNAPDIWKLENTSFCRQTCRIYRKGREKLGQLHVASKAYRYKHLQTHSLSVMVKCNNCIDCSHSTTAIFSFVSSIIHSQNRDSVGRTAYA